MLQITGRDISQMFCQMNCRHSGGTQSRRMCQFVDLAAQRVIEPVKISDINNTILHCLGIDNDRLSVKFQGLDARVTGVEESRVLSEVLA